MRLGVFLLFLAVALATAGAPAGAQLPSIPVLGEKADKEARKAEKEARKAIREALKAVKAATHPGPDDTDEDDSGGAGSGDDQGGPGTEDPGSGDDEGDPPDGDAAPGDGGGGQEAPPVDEPEGGPGDGEPDGEREPVEAHGSDTPARSTDGSEPTDEAQAAVPSDPGCPNGCGSPQGVHADAAAPAAETPGGLQAGSRALSYVEARAASPAALALLLLIAFGLIIGLAGALRALRGRLEESESR
jgi:hypothetical protein